MTFNPRKVRQWLAYASVPLSLMWLAVVVFGDVPRWMLGLITVCQMVFVASYFVAESNDAA